MEPSVEFLTKIGKSKYNILGKIGEGGLSEVWLGSNIENQDVVALKVMSLHSKNRNEIYQKEVQIGREHKHPNIVSCLDNYTFIHEDSNYGVLVFEKMDVDLMDYLLTKDRLTEETARFVFYEICKAVQFLHSKGVAHLDLKSDNILLNIDPCGEVSQVKLCDFGFAYIHDINSPNSSLVQFNSKVGTKEYQSPELRPPYSSKPYPVEKCDIWSLGVILFSTITGLFPFVEKKGVTSKVEFEVIKEFCDNDNCYKLIVSIFKANPNSRPSIEEILNHPWIIDDHSNSQYSSPTLGSKKKSNLLSTKVKNFLKKIV